MSDTNFNPYYEWLGIPLKEQPANHYRLLGIQLFESDPDVIESAAMRQNMHVRTFAIGKHGELSQEILNELATAKLCLLSPERKKEYDNSLNKPHPADQPVETVQCPACDASVEINKASYGKLLMCPACSDTCRISVDGKEASEQSGVNERDRNSLFESLPISEMQASPATLTGVEDPNRKSVASPRTEAIASLRSIQQTEAFEEGLEDSAAYQSILDRDDSLQGSESGTLRQQVEPARDHQIEAQESEASQKALLKKIWIGVGSAATGVFLLIVGMWGLSIQRATQLSSALEGQRWDEVLSMEPENVTALIGRVNQKLVSDNPDLAWILSEADTIKSLDPVNPAVNQINGAVCALQSVDASDVGNISTGEIKLREAKRLNADASYLDRANKSLAVAYAKRAESAVASGNITAAKAEISKATSFDPEYVLPATVTTALAESRASEMVTAYEADPNEANRSAAWFSLNKLQVLSSQSTVLINLRSKMQLISIALAESRASEMVSDYETNPSDKNRDAAVASVNDLEKLSAQSTVLVSLRSKMQSIAIALAESRASEMVSAYEADPNDTNRDAAVASINDLEKLNAQSTVLASLRGKPSIILVELVVSMEDSIKRQDFDGFEADYQELNRLDSASSQKITSLLSTLPPSVLSTLPPEVLSNLPPSVLSTLPPWVLSKLPPSITVQFIPPITNSIGMELKRIPSGVFTMGEGSDAHIVTLSRPFMLGVYEVTQRQYMQVMGSNPSSFRRPENPVERVSWEDAVEFCRKLSASPQERAEGRVYRLPTEAEWEYACRAGTRTKYGFGDDASDIGEYAWYSANSGGQTHTVGQKQPNAWGLHDMHGNVWEWCMDWYGRYRRDRITDPVGPLSGSLRVVRGGGWTTHREDCRSAYRGRYSPTDGRRYYFGFRVTCVPSGQ